MRIDGPAKAGPFSLVFSPGETLAPGLDVSADVRFVLRKNVAKKVPKLRLLRKFIRKVSAQA